MPACTLLAWSIDTARVFNAHGGRLLFVAGRLGSLWATHRPGAVPALAFHVVLFGHRGDVRGIAAELARPAQDDLSTSVVALHFTFNFNLSALQSANVAHLLQIAREDNERERALAEILAEIKEVHTTIPKLGVEDFSAHTPGGADVLLCVGKGHALGDGRGRKERE